MGWALIGKAAAGTNSANAAVTTSAISTVGADLLVLCATNGSSAGVAAISDSEGNTWTALTRQTTASGATQIFYVHNPTTDASHTFTIGAATGSLGSLTVFALAGSGSSPFDQEAGSTSSTTGSVTPTADGELIVSVYQDAGSFSPLGVDATSAALTGYTFAVVGSTRFCHMSGLAIQGSAAAFTMTFAPSGAITPCTSTATFKAAVSSGGGGGGAWAYA